MPGNYVVKEYIIAGGPVRMHVLIDEVEVDVDHPTNPVVSDTVISPYEEEILIGDKLAGKLGIIVYDFAEGIWRLKTDPEELRRRSEEREIWSQPLSTPLLDLNMR